MEERVLVVEYSSEMKQSYTDYSMSVIKGRALPDVRDGLKPVHRRILYAMGELDLGPLKPYRKSAKVVGEVMSKYHPHGDSAIYETMVGMAQPFKMIMPLIDGHGNWGSIDGDPAAAMRYTEARMTSMATEMLSDLQYGVVKMVDNFDGYHEEPSVLPTRFPNLLVNGVSGIAVGMATSMPPHNLKEVIDAVIEFLQYPNATSKKLMKHIKGPDFPTGGIITNQNDLVSIYENGEGKVRIRSKIEIQDASHGRKNLVVTEIPFTQSGTKTRLINRIIEMVNERKLEELSDVRDESDKDGIRIVLEVKKGINILNLLNKLYKKTPLEDSLSVHFLALVDDEPKTLSLRDIIFHFVEFQKEITRNKYAHLLEKAKNRQEVLIGFQKAVDVLDYIIEALRGSPNVATARECLMTGNTANITFKTKKSEKEASKFNFTEKQTDAIMNMIFQRLVQLEITKLNDELVEITKKIEKYEGILNNEKVLLATIKTSLNEIKKKYGGNRKTEITELITEDYVEEVKEEELLVIADRFGYIKAVDGNSFKRSGEDAFKEFPHTISIMNTDKVSIFTTLGNMVQVKAASIPKTKIKDRGTPLDNLVKLQKNEAIVWMGSANEVSQNQLLFVTKGGLVKVVEGSEYETNRSLISGIKLDKHDELYHVKLISIESKGTSLVIIGSHQNALRFDVSTIPVQKKNGKGVIGFTHQNDESVDKVIVLNKGEEFDYEISNQRYPLHTIRLRKRGSKLLPLSK